MFSALSAVLFERTAAQERDGQVVGVLPLPKAYLRKKRVAGATVGVRKYQHDGLAGGMQGLEGKRLPVEALEAKSGASVPTGSPAGC